MSRCRGILRIAILMTLAGVMAGCASTGARLCRPDPLKRPDLRFDEGGNGYVIEDHIYFSKEASSGGRATGGGGCGCN